MQSTELAGQFVLGKHSHTSGINSQPPRAKEANAAIVPRGASQQRPEEIPREVVRGRVEEGRDGEVAK